MSTREPAGTIPVDVGGAFHLPTLAWDFGDSGDPAADTVALGEPSVEPRSGQLGPRGFDLGETLRLPVESEAAQEVPRTPPDPYSGQPETVEEECPPSRPAAPTEDRPARAGISKPMVAAAAAAGLLLVSVPLLMGHLGSPGQPAGARQSGQPGYTQQDPGSTGLIPSAAPAPGAQPAGGMPTVVASSAVGVSPAQSAAAMGTGVPVSAGGQAGAVGVAGAAGAAAGSAAPRHPGKVAAPAPARPSYSAIVGPGCNGSGNGFTAYGYYNQGRSGWVTHAGGFNGSGCDGQFLSVPMSGDASRDDPTVAVTWSFATGSVTTGSCQVQVYIPDDSSAEAVGGSQAYYTVDNAEGMEASFTVDQIAQRGQWVSVGAFRVSGGRLVVQLHSRGQDWNSHGYDYAHLAASAASAKCTA